MQRCKIISFGWYCLLNCLLWLDFGRNEQNHIHHSLRRETWLTLKRVFCDPTGFDWIHKIEKSCLNNSNTKRKNMCICSLVSGHHKKNLSLVSSIEHEKKNNYIFGQYWRILYAEISRKMWV